MRAITTAGRGLLDPALPRWDRCCVSAPDDDAPAPRRGAVRPPPSLVPDDAPDTLDVPRLEPPPPSLEAMVQSAVRTPRPESSASWLLWVALVIVAAGVTAYVMR